MEGRDRLGILEEELLEYVVLLDMEGGRRKGRKFSWEIIFKIKVGSFYKLCKRS